MGSMNLELPTEGGDDDIWDTSLNTALTVIEAHDHTSGNGARVPSAGLNINADLAFASHAATGLKALAFAGVASYAVAKSLFVDSDDNELYWRTNGGTNIQLTNGAGLNISLVGGITGDYSTTDADVEYVDAEKAFEFKQDEGPDFWAKLKVGDIKLHQTASGITNAITLKSPAALAASYDLTMPTAVPAATALVTMSSAGVLATPFTTPSLPAKAAALRMATTGAISAPTSRTFQFSWQKAETSGLGNWAYSLGDGLISTTTTADLAVLWLEGLEQGCRLVSCDVHVIDGATSTIEVKLQEVADDGTFTNLGTAVTSAGSGAKQHLTVTATSPQAVATEKKYIITAESKGGGGNARKCFSASVVVDYGA